MPPDQIDPSHIDPSHIDIVKFSADHLEGALTLSRQAGWPHRLEDWAMVLFLSVGFVAIENGRVVGTTFVTLYGAAAATINMVIVDEAMRGRGIGRRLMDMALAECGDRECRLNATKEGLPLYTKLGFKETGRILQHQGALGAGNGEASLDWASVEDLADCATLDQSASGLERFDLIKALHQAGRIAVLRPAGKITAFAALRAFGHGEVIGPVVAGHADEAKTLIAGLIEARQGQFVRVDTTKACGLASWLEAQGLANVGGGIAMRRGAKPSTGTSAFQTFALASQALG
ncbi:GNAT family N-acetyltransferase [Rhizobium sp. L51/94]|uniref:GNAT family N-acetyltransferase n=1 Tax=Rhizobium sp. L51/94 TaxID=2819999 RepID=UPI00214CB2C4|nr:GNAT family N-acetyltransferase [Rhizobium sp. L51/94]